MKKILPLPAALLALLPLYGCRDAASVGIIGQADGPTTILVSGRPFWLLPVGLAALAAAIAAIVLVLTRRKK
ncbi:MAG: hypothetical protein ACK5L3_08480 [Oscillospiraceae bacterium]